MDRSLSIAETTESDAAALDREAAEWIVRLTDDDETERMRAQQGFDTWRQSGVAQAEAGARMQALLERLQGLKGHSGGSARPALAALDAAVQVGRQRARIRRVTTALLLVCLCAMPGWLVWRAFPPAYWLADMRTGTGQWQTHTLSDGSRITLNSDSGVDLHYDASSRTVVLVRGEVLIDVVRDTARPFIVETGDGSMRALGTRFVVSRGDAFTRLGMIESTVEVRPAQADTSADPLRVHAGQQVSFNTRGVEPVEAIDAAALDDAWRLHQLVVDNRPLAEVLEVLSRHRRGYIEYTGIDDIRVSAVLPLDRPDEALRLLQATLPGLRIRTLTPYLVWVDRTGQARPGAER